MSAHLLYSFQPLKKFSKPSLSFIDECYIQAYGSEHSDVGGTVVVESKRGYRANRPLLMAPLTEEILSTNHINHRTKPNQSDKTQRQHTFAGETQIVLFGSNEVRYPSRDRDLRSVNTGAEPTPASPTTMARLNTTNPLNTAVQQKKSLKERKEQFSINGPITDERSTNGRSSNGSSTSTMSTASSQRHSRGSSAIFDIFTDDSSIIEDSSSSPRKQKKTRTLKAANVNSLLLPITQTPRQRPSVKLETDDYEKENDILENTPEQHTTREEALQASPARRNMPRTPRRGRADNMLRADNTPLRPQSPGSETEEDCEDNSFDSLDDFIVSDNEDLSFHETSNSETEHEEPPSPPPPPKTTRKRLMRGRRPDADSDKKPLDDRLPKAPFRLEPRIPKALSISSSPGDSPKHVSQEDLNLSTKLNFLNLNGDNEPASQLETKSTRYGLQDVFVYQDEMVFLLTI